MHKNTPKSFFYFDFWEVIYVQKYNCTVLLKCLTNGFISLVFLSKNKIPLDRVACKRNIKGRKPTSICGFNS